MNNIFLQLIKTKIEQFENDYINLSRQIFVDSSGKIIHPGEFGTYREKIIRNFLKPFLPTRLDIGNGFIITSKDRISSQCDIIIYDKEYTPIIENGEQKFFPVECVVGVIEAKSKLTKSTLRDALIKLSKIKDLRNDIDNNPYIFKNYSGDSAFNPKLKVRDQMATFLICESIEMDIEKEINSVFSDIYKEIDKSLFHNMILNIDNYCLLYFDGKHPLYHAYFDYEKDVFKNECKLLLILPSLFDEVLHLRRRFAVLRHHFPHRLFHILRLDILYIDAVVAQLLRRRQPFDHLIQFRLKLHRVRQQFALPLALFYLYYTVQI